MQYKKIKIKFKYLIYFMILYNIVFPISIVAVSLPTFAIVDEAKEIYKTAESSINTDTSVETAAPSFSFKSKSQLLMELATGEVLYSNNENEKLLPASVTKVMTLLLIMEALDSGKISYNDTITCSENAAGMGGSQIWLQAGEKLSITDALKCICIVSANDVSVAMAEHIAGSEGNFVQMMNEKSKELGMLNTHFMNSHGIDEENHYTTAKDIAIMSRELVLKHPDILKYTSIWMDSIRDGAFGLSNTNKLIRFYEGAVGLKTGSTSKALFNLSAVAKREDMTLIAVVMTAPSGDIRNSEITQLLNYGFANYQVEKLATKGGVISKLKINKNVVENLNIVFENDETILSKKGTKNEYIKNIIINQNIIAPIKKGTKIGMVQYINNENKIIKEANIIADNDIYRSNLWDYFKTIIKSYQMTI